jgi:hypothetical protein
MNTMINLNQNLFRYLLHQNVLVSASNADEWGPVDHTTYNETILLTIRNTRSFTSIAHTNKIRSNKPAEFPTVITL